MDDPWHEETLRALLTYLTATKRGVRALVVTSNDALATQVEEAIRAALGDRQFVDLQVGPGIDPVDVFTPVLRSESRPGRLVLVKGLGDGQADTVGGEGSVTSTLSYVNLNRELFDREGEGFAFFMTPSLARAIPKMAADFGRYTQSFKFETTIDIPPLGVILRDLKVAIGSVKPNLEDLAILETAYRDDPHELNLEKLSNDVEARFWSGSRRDIVSTLEKLGRTHGYYGAKALSMLAEIAVHSGDLRSPVALLTRAREFGVTTESQDADALRLRAAGCTAASLARCIKTEYYAFKNYGVIDLATFLNRWHVLISLGRLRESRQMQESMSSHRLVSDFLHERSSLDLKAISLYWTGALVASCDMLSAFLASIRDKPRNADWYYQSLIVAGRLKEAWGCPQSSLAFFEECASEEHRQERILLWFEAKTCLGENLLTLGHTKRAATCLQETLATAEDLGYGLFVPDLELSLGRVEDAAGRTDEAVGRYRGALRKALEMGKALVASDCQRHLGRLYRLQGKTELAELALTTVLSTERHSGARAHETRTLTELSHLARDQGDVEMAQSYARDALAILRETRFRIDEPAALAAQAAAYQAAGRDELAEPIHDRWRRLVEGIGATGLCKWITRTLGSPES